MTRPIPIRSTAARLIYQDWQHKMVEIDQGHMVYDWDHMPGDVKEAWEDAVSSILNWQNENLVRGIGDMLSVQTNVRCDRPHQW